MKDVGVIRPGLLILGIVLVIAGILLMGWLHYEFDVTGQPLFWLGVGVVIGGIIAIFYWIYLSIRGA